MNRLVVGADASAAGVAALQWSPREVVSRQVPLHAPCPVRVVRT
jgi:hypothetical protein